MSAVKWILSIFLCFSFVFLAVFGVNCVYGYLFPIKFQEEVAAASEESGLDEAVIFSVINVESRFNPNAVSPKGAVGLMQVMPSTAQEMMKILSAGAKTFLQNKSFEENISQKTNEKSFSMAEDEQGALEGKSEKSAEESAEENAEENKEENDDEENNKNSKNGEKSGFFAENLKNPATNIMLGAKYLKSLLTRFENLDTALCAYNAGPATVKSWLANAEYSADGKTLAKIPYSETRNYLEKFHKNFKYYSAKTK